ncbi:MAG: hypothetical protein IPI38_08610 [Gemmatimonadetes bacterium]|nr:hypothetical protein [Gemmatimonadota bacterium]MBK7715471.1 hypothetical protein [Gemmatimonadota bacterium]MBK9693312.1 hypothetical protein [Gemmatimonadota bacterium]
MRNPILAAALLALVACGPYTPPLPPSPPADTLPPARTSISGAALLDLRSRTSARLQAVSVVNEKVVWASGTGGAFAVTTNGGASWRSGVVAGADSLEFRDVQGVDDKTAYLLSSGNGTRSRIYKTTDAGQNWQIQFINRTPEAFYDCFAFWDAESGIAFSDNVNGVFPVLATRDGGLDWHFLSEPGSETPSPVPAATAGEGAFAASGTCVATLGKEAAYIATGAGTRSRLLFTPDRGRTWVSYDTPVSQGTNTTGHTSIAFQDERTGLVVGGDIGSATSGGIRVALTADGGRRWTEGGQPTFPGAVYGAAWVPGSRGTVVAVGPGGASLSRDEGRTWAPLDSLAYWSVAFAGPKAGWMVGPGGRITKVSF